MKKSYGRKLFIILVWIILIGGMGVSTSAYYVQSMGKPHYILFALCFAGAMFSYMAARILWEFKKKKNNSSQPRILFEIEGAKMEIQGKSDNCLVNEEEINQELENWDEIFVMPFGLVRKSSWLIKNIQKAENVSREEAMKLLRETIKEAIEIRKKEEM